VGTYQNWRKLAAISASFILLVGQMATDFKLKDQEWLTSQAEWTPLKDHTVFRGPWRRKLRGIGRRRTGYITLLRRERERSKEGGEVIKYVFGFKWFRCLEVSNLK
jgi:hypothetical protein